MTLTDDIRHAIAQANASLLGIPHEMSFPTAIEKIKEWSDDINDAWENMESGEITESYDQAEEWMLAGERVTLKERDERLAEVVGKELARHL
jgi:hypothetical protein